MLCVEEILSSLLVLQKIWETHSTLSFFTHDPERGLNLNTCTSNQGFIQVFWDRGNFHKMGENFGHWE